MKKRIICFLSVITIILGLLGGCSKADDTTTNQPNQATNDKPIDENGVGSNSTIDTIDTLGVELSHTYTTRFGDVNSITFPEFYFDYPDGWTITSEEVTPTTEEVVLTNDTGVTVTYWYFGGMRDLTGPTRNMNRVDVTQVASASFVPGYVQATDYSDLGRFMVAKLKITGEYDMLGGGEYHEIENGRVRYALLPEGEAGEQEECIIVGLPTFSFYYGGHISLIANSPSGEFTEREEQEVIAILASFRNTPDPLDISPNPADNNTTITIDELWSMLDGTWIFEEYEHMGKVANYRAHSMELHYVDGKPCMSEYFQGYDGYYPDTVFYDCSALDETHYIAYTYKKGSYGGDWENWSSDVLSVWYSFDLSNLSDGELLLGYHMAFDNGFVDNDHLFRYSQS